jgi:Ribbon-helix-helix protein, copG family
LETQFLTVRLGEEDASLLASLNEKTGASKSEIIKRALREYAAHSVDAPTGGLFALGEKAFGKYADATRQSAELKTVVRNRIDEKRTRR